MKWLGRGLVALGVLSSMAASPAASAAATSNFADDQQITALQQVIQHSNDEQVQAIATSNPSLVTDTVTGDYGAQMVDSLRTMLDNHVTSIQLLNLQWGPASIAADGSSATVTTFETWRIVSTAGSVDDAPARNDYTLVVDNGTWKIKADTQTIGADTPVPTSTPTVTPTVPTATPTASPVASDTPTPTPTDVPMDTPPQEEPTNQE